ncbi:hypothetical protein GALMADRAFT_214053 [Galerina marginata CBS 339.88]|uniref:Uncharacterized protein n=1 Tax=Galerina marginata (strain CBS 339.88) TaxID=685588 RepID=A0A067STL3_GALM3|nr:hypothetical protein GALMADRAFT_214053 [Galerina marginata CBS 339.88]
MDVRKLLDDEVLRDPTRLFDGDDGVEMASIGAGGNRRSSSKASRPPTSESEGLFDDQEHLEGQETEENEIQHFLWSVLPSSLLAQPIGHQIIVAIKIIDITLVTHDPWPELHQAAPYKQEVLLDAVKLLIIKDKQYKEYRSEIRRMTISSKSSVNGGSFQVIDRLSHHRNTRSVASDHIALFQLGINEGCKEQVKASIENDVRISRKMGCYRQRKVYLVDGELVD